MRGKPPAAEAQAAADCDLALRAFAHVAADAELVAGLLATTGVAAADLRQLSTRPEFAGFVLDFLLEQDARVLGFARAEGIAPEAVLQARIRLEHAG